MKESPSVLLVDDDDAFRGALSRQMERLGYRVTSAGSGGDAVLALADAAPDVVLLDLRLPDVDGMQVLKRVRERTPNTDVIMLTGHGTIDGAIEAIRAGAFDYVAKPCPLEELEVRIQRALERQSLRRRASLLERGLTPPDVGGAFVGDSPGFRQVVELVGRVAPTHSTVLITGETGAGKEMVAKLIHARSPRRERPFVTVESAALQESLLESELFGHERGAFTGADRAKPGLFEVAHGGTIFLDEIGEVSPATQVKLLRVLDTSTFRHLGGTVEIKVDVRVIAATNRDLESMVRQGLFREDLFYRLRTITITVPPLRERRTDVALLARHFAAAFNERFGFRKRLGAEVLAVLQARDWPGNVRELLHVIEGAMIVCEGDEIRPQHLTASTREPPPRAPADASAGEEPPLRTLDQMERAHIEIALRRTNGHRGHAARLLGISERSLYRKLREYGLVATEPSGDHAFAG
jgi:two-component system, NtrC family, response regulator AtoC